ALSPLTFLSLIISASFISIPSAWLSFIILIDVRPPNDSIICFCEFEIPVAKASMSMIDMAPMTTDRTVRMGLDFLRERSLSAIITLSLIFIVYQQLLIFFIVLFLFV